MRKRKTLVVAAALLGLAACDRLLDAYFGFGPYEVVLLDKPTTLGPKAIRLQADDALQVRGYTSDLCLVLTRDLPKGADEDAARDKLRGGAHLKAVLHVDDGKDFTWTCGSGQVQPREDGRSTLSACLRMECNDSSPAKGAKITAIDLSADRPLRILEARWSSSDHMDHWMHPEPDRVAESSAEYRALESRFGGQTAWTPPPHFPMKIELDAVPGAEMSEYNATLGVRMEARGIQLEPKAGSVGMGVVTIPTSAVTGCTMECWGPKTRYTTLLVPDAGLQLELLEFPQAIDWCWANRVPLVTREEHDAWDHGKGPPTPAKAFDPLQFPDRAAYEEAAEHECGIR
jgi:hypothetical protein